MAAGAGAGDVETGAQERLGLVNPGGIDPKLVERRRAQLATPLLDPERECWSPESAEDVDREQRAERRRMKRLWNRPEDHAERERISRMYGFPMWPRQQIAQPRPRRVPCQVALPRRAESSGRPRAQATRSSARSGDSGESESSDEDDVAGDVPAALSQALALAPRLTFDVFRRLMARRSPTEQAAVHARLPKSLGDEAWLELRREIDASRFGP